MVGVDASSEPISLGPVGLGCWAIGGMWWGDDVTDERSIAAIHAALDQGIDWVDTAPLYGHGHADEVLRKALGPRLRDVTVATKVGVRWDRGGDHAESDLTPAHVIEDCEASLRRLGVERIDLLQVHWPCERGTPLDETVAALEDLAAAGKVRAWGLCNYGPEALRAVLDGSPKAFASLQTPYSMVRRELEHGLAEVLLPPGAARPVVRVLAYETLCRGLLTGKFRTLPRFPKSDLRVRDTRFWGASFARSSRFVALLRQAGERVGAPPAALAVAWVLSRPFVTSAIVGVKGPEQVEDLVLAARLSQDPRVVRLLDRVVATFTG